jgi:hypothetical protein
MDWFFSLLEKFRAVLLGGMILPSRAVPKGELND